MNENTAPPQLPEISHTSADGTVWTFDPNGPKWTAVINGKKTSSKDYRIVREKASAAAASEARSPAGKPKPVKAPPSIEVPMILAVETTRPIETPLGVPYGQIKHSKRTIATCQFKPAMVKIAWDADEGAMQVQRYKTIGTKSEDGTWKSRRHGDSAFFHPSFLTKEIKACIETMELEALIVSKFKNAYDEIISQWWDKKPSATQCWTVQHRNGLVITQAPISSMDSHRYAQVYDQWRVERKEEDKDYSRWAQQEDGSLLNGQVRIRMEAGHSSYFPDFQVYIPTQEEPVFSTSDFSLAIVIGDASASITRDPPEVVKQWLHCPKKGKKEFDTDPILFETHGALLFDAPKDAGDRVGIGSHVPHLYLLTPTTKDGKTFLHWTHTSAYHAQDYRNTGPEDKAMEIIKRLRRDLLDLLADTPHVSLVDVAKDNINTVASAVEDGDELSLDPVSTMTAFNNYLDRVRAQVANSEIAHQASDLVEDALNTAGLILDADQGPRSRTAKPR